jgi:2,4-dienoyl-CoA reductase-like NADH-dependent reductase (Old Yellow Enzyme family)
MTTVAYCAVHPDGRSYATEMWMRPEIVPALRELTDAVHREGCAASLQIGHCGGFSDPRVTGIRGIAPSRFFVTYRLGFAREATAADLARLEEDFAATTRMAREAGFDAVEVHGGHGYLLSQFLSPWSNRRIDGLGGSLEDRMQWPARVVARVREAAGPAMAVLVKMNLEDGFRGGQAAGEAPAIARGFAGAGADGVVLSGGFTSRTPFYMLRGDLPVREMVRNEPSALRRLGLTLFGRLVVPVHPYRDAFFLEDGLPVVRESPIPVVLVGGVHRRRDMIRARGLGYAAFALGRPTIRDPDFPSRLARGEVEESDCDRCNRCVAAMDGGGVRCVTRDQEGR